MDRWYTYILRVALLLGFVVIGLGAYTRLVDGGLGCPDWPGCYGHLVVPSGEAKFQAAQAFGKTVEPIKAWAEMIHRYVAGTLGMLIGILASMNILKPRVRGARAGGVALLLLLAMQAVLGMWTVTWLLLPLIVSGHLLGGMGIVASLWWLNLKNKTNHALLIVGPYWRYAALFGLVLLVLQIALGAWISTNYASLSCPDFPRCQGQWMPAADFRAGFDLSHPIGVNYEGGVLGAMARVAIHWLHRVGALVIAVYWAFLSLVLLWKEESLQVRNRARWIIFFLVLQCFLGILNVVWQLPLAIAVGHNIVAAMLLLSVIAMNEVLWQQRVTT